MPSCVVKSCKNYMSKFKKSKGITYHSFPRNKKRKDDWVSVIRNCRGENNWNPSSASTVCSKHFDDIDFITTAKGLRCLVPNAIPKRLLSNPQEIQTQSTSSPILQKSPDVKEEPHDVIEEPNDPQPPSSPSTISSLLQSTDVKEEPDDVIEEPNDPQPPSSPSTITTQQRWSLLQVKAEFALIGYCRLCAASNSDGKLLDIQSDNVLRKLVVNMSNRLNINIDFNQEHLPTTICSVCVKSLYTAYDFVVGIDLAHVNLNKILMQKKKYQMPENLNICNKVDLSSTSLQQTNNRSEAYNSEQVTLHAPNTTVLTSEASSNIEVAVNDIDQPLVHVSSSITPLQRLSPNTGAATSNVEQPPLVEIGSTIPFLQQKYKLSKKIQIIALQKKNLKRLNQKVRRLQNRNESLKNIIKNLQERNNIGTDLL